MCVKQAVLVLQYDEVAAVSDGMPAWAFEAEFSKPPQNDAFVLDSLSRSTQMHCLVLEDTFG
jgi:hypothetical protein